MVWYTRLRWILRVQFSAPSSPTAKQPSPNIHQDRGPPYSSVPLKNNFFSSEKSVWLLLTICVFKM